MSIYGAMFAGVSGLAAQSNALGMISDNLANVNTLGYKGTSARFSTLVTQAATPTTHQHVGVTAPPYSFFNPLGLRQCPPPSPALSAPGPAFSLVNEQSPP